jgi:hypothetical protein
LPNYGNLIPNSSNFYLWMLPKFHEIFAKNILSVFDKKIILLQAEIHQNSMNTLKRFFKHSGMKKTS